MLDLLITNASLPDGRTGMSVAVQDGRITEVTAGLSAPATETVDAKGYLLTPPFCDPHFHMDASPQLRPAARQRERHAAGRHRGVGRAQAHAQSRSHHRTRPHLLRLGRRQGPAGHPQPCGHQRPQPAAGGRTAGGEEASRALHRSAAGRLSARRRTAHARRRRQPQARAGHGRGHRRRHPALRAHHGRGRGQRQAAVRDRGRARQAGGHALRRDRRPHVAPHRNAGFRGAAPGPAGPRQRQPLHLHAQHGQLLREQADAADRRERREHHRQPADQHHAARTARHLPQAKRHDPRARADGRRRQRRLRPRLRDGPLVRHGLGRHAGSGAHGAARGADDESERDQGLLRRGDDECGEGDAPGGIWD